MVFALIGMSVFALCLLGALVVVFMRDGSERDDRDLDRAQERPIVAAAPSREEFRSSPAPEPVETPASVAVSAPPEVATPEPAAPKTADPQEVIRKLKDATVYLKNKINGKTVSSGTGFVIEVQGDTVLLATNRHVAVLDLSEIPSSIAPPGTKPTLEAIFRSGQGTKVEQVLTAEIIAADLSDEFNTDLAFLRVKGVRQPPVPINIQNRMEPSEGLHYVGAGFPLGGLLNNNTESKSNPSVTITGGRIAALRRDDSGQLSLLQVDGSLQPGNSGGPIIDERTGNFLGVAVAKVGSVDTIGFVVPAEELRRALNGRVGAVALTLQESPQGTAELQVKAQVVDPKNNIKGVAVHIVPASTNPMPSPLPDGSWPSITKSKEVELKHDANQAEANGSLKVTLSGEGPESRKVFLQTAFKNAQGKLVFGKPREILLPEKPGRIMQPGRLERILRMASRKSINLLGPLLDNSKDCELSKDESTYKVRIDIPNKLHTLSPEIANNRNIPIHNAPITATEVEGDFAAVVEVGGDIDPGNSPPKDPRGRKLPFTVQSQGLIIYQDKDNFLRLERAESVLPRTLTPVHRLIIEFVQKDRHAIPPIYYDVPDRNTLLILVRRKGRIRCLFSPDDGRTVTAFREFAADLPPKVRVGLTAANISSKPFEAVFSAFAILSDDNKIDREFGE